MINLRKNSFIGKYLLYFYGDLPKSKLGVVINSLIPIFLSPLVIYTHIVLLGLTFFTNTKFSDHKTITKDGFLSFDGVSCMVLFPTMNVGITILLMITDLIEVEPSFKGLLVFGVAKTLCIFVSLSVVVKVLIMSYNFIKNKMNNNDEINWK